VYWGGSWGEDIQGPYICDMTPAQAAAGRLVVCPTPIGNLEDVTLRSLVVLQGADVVACEDTRHAKILLDRYGLTVPLLSFHEHNERARATELIARMRGGEVVALISDAGTPLLSDPGFSLVRDCIQAGISVEVLPGASAVLTALIASGLPVQRWLFVGFLPRKRAELDAILADAPETVVAFESPRRLARTLGALAAIDPERPVAVCRELTKLHEEVRRGSAAELATHYEKSPPRGEIVLVFGCAAPGRAPREEAFAALRDLIDAGAKPRAAAAAVGKLTGLAANELYRELMRAGQ
jgi:16S rRNA (cytidine1402-2'-O)-methyltransferase